VDAVSVVKFGMDHWEELGSGFGGFFLFLAFGYHKYIQKQLNGLHQNIKKEQSGDREQFKKVKRDLRDAIKNIHEIEVKVAYKKTKLDKFEQELEKMIIDLEAQEKLVTDNAHKIELNERDVSTVKGILEDIIGDVKEFQKRSSNMEMSLAKMLGALSRNFE
tara:strand:+ start:1835 stop:2320 length:486 start_codon:yes stop_codon:yes gene_type:complete